MPKAAIPQRAATLHGRLVAGVVAVLVVADLYLVQFKLGHQPAFVDYLVMWTGGRFADAGRPGLYDPAVIDQAQAWLLGSRAHDRPFPYPPSALLVFAPLARAPFWVSAWTWTIGGAVAFCLAIWRSTPVRRGWTLAAALAAPGVALAALSGQCAPAVGALVLFALIKLNRRPGLAGVMLGLAAALKPTLLLMAPVALIAGGHRRALAFAFGAGLATGVASIVLFGAAPWIDWLTDAPRYLARISADPRYRTAIITPTGLAIRFGAGGGWLLALRIAFLAAGATLAAVSFRRDAGVGGRLTGLIGGSLLAAPYAMTYETALLAPAAALALIQDGDRRRWLIACPAYIALAIAGLPNVGVWAFLAYLVLASIDFVGEEGEPSRSMGRP